MFLSPVSLFYSSQCGAGDGSAPTDGSAVTFTAGTISLATSQVSVKSDSSDSATITATVLDKNNVVVKGATVTFTTNGGTDQWLIRGYLQIKTARHRWSLDREQLIRPTGLRQ